MTYAQQTDKQIFYCNRLGYEECPCLYQPQISKIKQSLEGFAKASVNYNPYISVCSKCARYDIKS